MQHLQTAVIYICSSLAFLITAVYILSLCLGIKRIMWYQEKQVDFLTEMAKSAGVNEEKIKELIKRPQLDTHLLSFGGLLGMLVALGLIILLASIL